MNPLIDRLIIYPLEKLLERIFAFLPNLLSALLIMFVGVIVGWVVMKGLRRVFVVMKLEILFEDSGLKRLFDRSGIHGGLSAILAKVAGWLVIIIFGFIALGALNVPAIERLLERFVLYTPNVIVGLLILVLGYFLGNFLARAVLITSVNAGIHIAGLIARLVKVSVFLLSLTIALEQLGIGKDTVLLVVGISFGGVILALAIAFGLGGKDLAREYLQRKIGSDKRTEDDISHL